MSRRVGRYHVGAALASGGMGSVHVGRLESAGGFSRLVAIKVLHANYASDPEFRAMFLDEARIVSRIRHPNVVSTLDVLEEAGELFIVMDYVDGVSLTRLLRDGPIPVDIAVSIVVDALEGLHAAHEARTEEGVLLDVVHRDVSPQNIMVTVDGSARVVDFGIAQAADRSQSTVPGQVKGKAAYMAPEQARGERVDRRADTYSASVVLWELLTHTRLFNGPSFAAILLRQLGEEPRPPSELRSGVSMPLDAVVLRGLAKNREDRYETAHEMAAALRSASPPASRAAVAAFVRAAVSVELEQRAKLIAAAPSTPSTKTTDEHETNVGVETVSRGTSRSRSRVGVAVVMAAAAAGGFIFVRSKLTHPAQVAAPVAMTSLSASSLPPDLAPSASTIIEPPAATFVALATGSVQAAPATGRRATFVPPHVASVAPSASAPRPPCCVNNLQMRFHDCEDNCPR